MAVLPGTKRILAALLVIDTRLSAIETTLRKIMSEQDQANAVAAQIETDVAAENTATTAIEAEIAALQAANPSVDFTSLNQAVTDLNSATASEQAVVPPPAS